MNVIEKAKQAYAPNQTAVRSARSVEAQLISQITSRMQRSSSTSQWNFNELIAAVHENRRMWTAIAVDVADEGNALPKELRAQLFYLAEFTDRHTRQVIRGEADISALVDINIAVLKGLNGPEN